MNGPATATSTEILLGSLGDYLKERSRIIAAREGFFHALRTHLRPEQRVDAYILGDRLALSPARQIQDAEWVVNPSRGYITILPNLPAGRVFRLSVLQLGQVLRIGVRIPALSYSTDEHQRRQRLHGTFPEQAPRVVVLAEGDQVLDWEFSVPDLYQSALAMETAIFRVSALFENALQATLY